MDWHLSFFVFSWLTRKYMIPDSAKVAVNARFQRFTAISPDFRVMTSPPKVAATTEFRSVVS